MYCPKCLNNTMSLASRGVVNISVNGMQRDTGRFLFNTSKESKEEIAKNFEKKLEEFFAWYSEFKNPEPIKYVQLTSSDYVCESGCHIALTTKMSVVNILVPASRLNTILNNLGKKYNMKIELEEKIS